MVFVLPKKSEVGVLDPEIAGEGERVIYSDGEQMSWTPPPARPVMPDWSQIKSIAKYFNRIGHQVWPAWLYHPGEEPRLVKNATEAAALGVCYREATADERGRYGVKAVWDYTEETEWRSQPYDNTIRFDPNRLGQGKTYVASAPNPAIAQNALLEALIPAVAAAVAQSLKATGPGAPANVDQAQWEAFLQFQAFQKAAEAVDIVKAENSGEAGDVVVGENGLTADQERRLWQDEAEVRGIKVDGRWSLAKLKAEVEKAA